jgi:hypothetical protein
MYPHDVGGRGAAGKYQKIVFGAERVRQSPPHFHNGGKQKAKFQMTLTAIS